MEVTNALATNLILDHLSMQTSRSTGESASLIAELESVKRRLNEKESALKTYQEKYGGGLPEQLKVDLSTLEGLRVQLNQKKQKLKRAEDRRIKIIRELGRADKDARIGANGPSATSSEMEEELQKARERLAKLQESKKSFKQIYVSTAELLGVKVEIEDDDDDSAPTDGKSSLKNLQ